MHKFFTLVLSIILVVGSAFKPVNGIDDVISALRVGNATEVGKYIDENVELSLPDKSDNYSKAQAIMILKDFFANNVVSGFETKHTGETVETSFVLEPYIPNREITAPLFL